MRKLLFICNKITAMKTVLSITGSDGTGGSGVQADIRAITLLGAQAVTAITSITVQSTLGIQSFFDLPANVVSGQIEAIFNDMDPQIVKIGMLRRIDVVESVAEVLKKYHPKHVILDTVAHSSSGDKLMTPEVMATIKKRLLPLCTLVITRPDDNIFSLSDYASVKRLTIDGRQGHGHGNLLSSAIAVMLSRGENMQTAIDDAKKYLGQLIPEHIEQTGRAASLYNNFLDCLERFFMLYKDVSFYAEQLNVSSRYLAQVTKRFAEKTPKTLIDERIANEIERQMRTSDKTVQEIAIALGFSSQAQLSRFFRKMRNQSPSQFRKTLNT